MVHGEPTYLTCSLLHISILFLAQGSRSPERPATPFAGCQGTLLSMLRRSRFSKHVMHSLMGFCSDLGLRLRRHPPSKTFVISSFSKLSRAVMLALSRERQLLSDPQIWCLLTTRRVSEHMQARKRRVCPIMESPWKMSI
jgi:hypothetical protein